MTSRTSRYLLGLITLLAAHGAAAVGLGEFKLLSAMNEPLRAEIDLLSVGDLNETQIAARLASPEDFKRSGVDRDFQLTDLRFRVDLSNSAHPVIRVTSQRPIKEPYLNFLVELRWTSGRLLREYTTLLDLPVYAGAQHAGKTPAAAAPAAAASPSPEEPALEPPKRAPGHGAARAAARASAAPGGSYRVQAGDTLWNIATRYQAPGVTIPQAMQAIAAANPEAFIRGNPNLIRRDALLNLPDAAAMAAVDARLAARQVQAARQPAIESRAVAAEQSAAGNADGELRLAGAGGGGAAAGSGTGAGSRQSGSAAGAAGKDLGAVLEEKDRLERENTELKARVANLEEQAKAASRLVEIRDAGLAALQTGAQKAPADAGTAAAGATPPAAPMPESSQPAESAQGPETGAPVATTQTAPAPEPQAAAPPVPAPMAPAAEEKPADAVAALRAWLVPALGIAGALLLLVMGLAAWRGRTQQQGLQLPSEFEGKGTRPPAFNAAAAPAVLDDEDLLPEAQGFADQPDQILEEVDVCLSFGNEQQACELLTAALERYPAHSGLHLKMLELLVQEGDQAGCDALLPKIRALGDARATATAIALMRELQVSDEETPGGAAPKQVAEIIPHPAAARTETARAVPERETEDFALDLDLNLDLPKTPPPAATTGVKPEASGDLADFDLELLDDNLPASSPDTAEPFSGAAAAAPVPMAPLDTDLDLFEPGQEMATQIELAEAYVDMGDAEGAREILDYVLEGGDETQKESARRLLARLG